VAMHSVPDRAVESSVAPGLGPARRGLSPVRPRFGPRQAAIEHRLGCQSSRRPREIPAPSGRAPTAACGRRRACALTIPAASAVTSRAAQQHRSLAVAKARFPHPRTAMSAIKRWWPGWAPRGGLARPLVGLGQRLGQLAPGPCGRSCRSRAARHRRYFFTAEVDRDTFEPSRIAAGGRGAVVAIALEIVLGGLVRLGLHARRSRPGTAARNRPPDRRTR